eukprot:2134402-Pyramimonas_sp.AAC.1
MLCIGCPPRVPSLWLLMRRTQHAAWAPGESANDYTEPPSVHELLEAPMQEPQRTNGIPLC